MALVRSLMRTVAQGILSRRTLGLLRFDLQRMRARAARVLTKDVMPASRQLHLGCGKRKIAGWLNVDVSGSDYDIDIACGRLPWRSNVFDAVVSQHVIEYLELESELLPLLRELHRVMAPDGTVWLSCPDMEKICRAYLDGNMSTLLADKHTRFPDFTLGDVPTVHLVNYFFHQRGENKNLFDYSLLKWALESTGFTRVERRDEADLLRQFPEIPERADDLQTLYVTARASKG
jgi:predicted SAM-dependent methyltransferase